MTGPVEHEFRSAGQSDSGEEPPSPTAWRPTDLHGLGSEPTEPGLDVVTHQPELALRLTVGRMNEAG
ncbi:hypothetical protein ACFU8W_10435 [Streptomyces sp. NPDC057565]|uniref:hypothetical protein n=1 Tax=Streptomyces sp. NPDC057565 TaxID=3346169 RepID=UPI0036A59D36